MFQTITGLMTIHLFQHPRGQGQVLMGIVTALQTSYDNRSFGLAHQRFAAPVLHGAPLNMGTMTVTGVDMNRDGTLDVVQQPQIGIAPQGFAASVQQGAPGNLGRRQ